jgi:TonB-dependent starch-binding outer membrane protein SusC
MKKILLLMGLLITSILQAQDKTITGKVTDGRDGVALSGVSVKQKGKTGGASTDASGNFSISVTGSNAFLEFSYVGYLTRTVRVSDDAMNITLDIDPKSLSEVVITGVGTATEKKRVAIDVASLSSKDVAKSAIGSVEQALQGKIAGAQVQFNTGTPGSGASIILRGLNSLIDLKPMILLDGIEVTDLNGLDLTSVDRVEVVKGAAAGMLYGAQGANGVIQVFTKKGARNKRPSVSLRTQVSLDEVTRLNDLIAKRHHFVTDNDGYIIRNGQRVQPDQFGSWPDPVFGDVAANPSLTNDKPYREKTYDHIDQAYGKAITFNNTMNISGGGEKSDYSFTVSRLDQENVFSNKFSRINLGANLGFELFKGFTLRSTTQVVFIDENLLNNDPSKGFIGTERFNLTNSWPYIDFKARDAAGNLVVKPKQENQLNPLSEAEWRERFRKSNRIIQNVNVNYKFPRFVELDYKYGIEIWNTDENDYYKNQSAALQSATAFWGTSRFGSIRNDFTKDIFQNSLATVYIKTDFEKDFGLDIPLRTVSQVSYDYRNFSSRNFFAQGTVLPSYPPFNINVAANRTSGDLQEEFTTFGFLFNQTFDWGNLAGLSVGFRSDYSSEFGDAKKAFTFPRGTVYFRPSELLKSRLVTDWKVRGAYGEAGIQPDRYSRQVTLGVLPLGNGVGLYLPAQASNPLLRVQRSKELEIGTDLTVKPNLSGNWLTRIVLSATYWNRTSEDIIQPASLAPSAGFESIIDNLTTIKSRGFDISLDADVTAYNNFTWDFGFRFGKTKSFADKIANGADIINGVFSIKQGSELGLFYMQAPVTSLNQLKADKTPYIPQAQQGDFELVNGIVVNKTTKQALLTDANDQKVVGSAYPNFTASFINSFTIYRNLVISAQLDWYQGNKIYNNVRQWLYRDRLSSDYDKSITVNGQPGAYVNFYNSLYNSVQPLSWFVEDGSFLRLRDVSVTYDLNSHLQLKWLKQLSLTLAGRNLFTITKYSGLDPEATGNEDSQGNPAVGVGAVKGSDYFRVPTLKSYQVSLNIGF